MRGKKKQQKQTATDRRLLAITLFTIAFFGFFAVRPSVNIIATLNKEKKEFQAVNETLETKIQKIIQMQTKFVEALSKKELIDEAVPPEHAIEDISLLLNRNITISSFNIRSIKFHPVEQQGLNTITVDFAGEASYQDILNLINDTFRYPRLFYLKELALEGDAQGTESAQIKFKAVIDTYYYVE